MSGQRPRSSRITKHPAWRGIALFLCLTGTACAAARGQVVNGSFEVPVVARQTSAETVAPQEPAARVPGWETDRLDGLLEIRRSGSKGIEAFEGEQFLEIPADSGSNVYQVIPTVPGRTYRWAFAYRPRAVGGELLMLIDDRVGVSRLRGKPDGWTYVEGTHLALGTIIRLEFRPARGTRVGSLLDAVVFEAQTSSAN